MLAAVQFTLLLAVAKLSWSCPKMMLQIAVLAVFGCHKSEDREGVQKEDKHYNLATSQSCGQAKMQLHQTLHIRRHYK